MGTRWRENSRQLAQFLSKPSVRVLNVTEEMAPAMRKQICICEERGDPFRETMSG